MFENPFGHPFGSGEPDYPEGGPYEPIPEAQRILQGLLAELPEEAQALVDKINRDIARIQEQASEEIQIVRAVVYGKRRSKDTPH